MARTQPELRVVKTPLSPARETLARINAEISELREAVARAQAPINALHAAGARLAAAEQRLAVSRSGDDKRLAGWLEGGREGPRPEPSHETLRLEAELVEARRDHAAAEPALPLRQEEQQRLQEKLGALASEQQRLVFDVCVEEIERVCSAELRPALAAFLRIENIVRGLEQKLWEIGRAGAGASLSAAHQAKLAIDGCRPDKTSLTPGPGEALLRALLADHEATLEVG
jgi:hypothetical protein